ncbi:MAG TPA: N-acetylmannosamine-6-phosphate 2-epimerase [Candidatus Dormibacteraeota bacterium]|nr:N-acetylmannosamine-6-phosphate 2-epimerase [Candidatus Dormibacteraeota bacterium]
MSSVAQFDSWRGGLIVSCQASAESALSDPQIIAAFARAAERNGAIGVRIDGPANIRTARAAVSIPIVGIEKMRVDGFDVYITPTYESAARVATSGADVLAVDGTPRARPNGAALQDIISRAHAELHRPVMADIASFDEAIAAVETAGADLIATTLSGYTKETKSTTHPDFELLRRLTSRLKVPVICEGHVRTTEDLRRAFDCGAFAVVVGKAITGVDWLVRQYVAATPGQRSSNSRMRSEQK